MSTITPLERSAPPPGLDGASGANRGRDDALPGFRVRTDREAIADWLTCHAERRPTWVNYRKEAERLLLWCWHERGIALSDFGRPDWPAYLKFLRSPPARWLSGVPRKREDSRWRPLCGRLGGRSLQVAESVLRSLFEHLCAEGYLARNPLAGAKRLSEESAADTDRPADVERHLSPAALRFALKATTGSLKDATRPKAAAALQRETFVATWLYYTGGRRAEIARARMGHVRRDKSSGADWWWRVYGKGGKTREVPLPDQALDALETYRTSLGLRPLPPVGDPLPLVCRLPGASGEPPNKAPLSGEAIYNIVKSFFARAAAAAEASTSKVAREYASDLALASTHWLRHSAFSEQVRAGVPLPHIQANAGHASINTTSGYLHASARERARSIRMVDGRTSTDSSD